MKEFTFDTVGENPKKINFVLTYGLQNQLQTYLFTDDNLFKLFSDPEVANTVISVCLSSRDKRGAIIEEFNDFDALKADQVTELLDALFDHFSEFFLKYQSKVKTLSDKLNQAQS